MAEKKSFLAGILGAKPTQGQQTIANIIGGAIAGGGIWGALQQKVPTYESASQGVQLAAGQVLPGFDKMASEEKKAFEADLAGYQQREVGRVESGLKARGITDKAVSGEAVKATKAGLSGAYAAARAALTGAKLRATTALQGTMGRYYMDLAQRQYKSQMQKYASQMGLWGALGGLGSSLIASASPVAEEDKKEPEEDKKEPEEENK